MKEGGLGCCGALRKNIYQPSSTLLISGRDSLSFTLWPLRRLSLEDNLRANVSYDYINQNGERWGSKVELFLLNQGPTKPGLVKFW